MSDNLADDAFKLFQRLEEAAKALDTSATTLNGMITGDVMTALKAARSTTADAAKQLSAVSTTATNLGTQITSARELVEAAKQNVEALPAQQSTILFIGMLLGMAVLGAALFAAETFWPSSSRESIQSAVLARIAETPESCTSAHVLLGTSWFWVTNNQGQKIAACGIGIIKQPPPPPPQAAPAQPHK